MSDCGRLTDNELIRALDIEAREFIDDNPGCPKLLAAFDCLIRKSTPGARTGAVIGAVNAEVGTTYDANIHGKWRRGERGIPEPVQAYMRRTLLDCVKGAEGNDIAVLLDG